MSVQGGAQGQVMKWELEGASSLIGSPNDEYTRTLNEEYEGILDEVVNAVLTHRKGVVRIEFSYYSPSTCCVKGSDALKIAYDPEGRLRRDEFDETMARVLYYYQDYHCGEHVYSVANNVVVKLQVDDITGIGSGSDDEELKERIKKGLDDVVETIIGNGDEDAIDIAQKLSNALQDLFFTERKGMKLELKQSGGPDCPGMSFDMNFYG